MDIATASGTSRRIRDRITYSPTNALRKPWIPIWFREGKKVGIATRTRRELTKKFTTAKTSHLVCWRCAGSESLWYRWTCPYTPAPSIARVRINPMPSSQAGSAKKGIANTQANWTIAGIRVQRGTKRPFGKMYKKMKKPVQTRLLTRSYATSPAGWLSAQSDTLYELIHPNSTSNSELNHPIHSSDFFQKIKTPTAVNMRKLIASLTMRNSARAVAEKSSSVRTACNSSLDHPSG